MFATAAEVRPVLRTERLLLRPFRAPDLEAFHQLRNDPATWRFVPFEIGTIDASHHHLAERMRQDRLGRAGDTVSLAVLAGSRLIGELRATWWPHSPSAVELTGAIRRSSQHHGYGEEAAQAALALLLGDLWFEKATVWLHSHDRRSRALLLRLGFVHRDHVVEATRLDEEWIDEDRYSLQRRTWQQRQTVQP